MTTVTSRSRVLEAYYPIITTLSTYLDALLPSKAQQWTQHEDPDSFRRLLTTTIVATESPLEEIPKFDFYPPACSQSDVCVFPLRRQRGSDCITDHGPRAWSPVQEHKGKVFQCAGVWIQNGMCRKGNAAISYGSPRPKIATKLARYNRGALGSPTTLLIPWSSHLPLGIGRYCCKGGALLFPI